MLQTTDKGLQRGVSLPDGRNVYGTKVTDVAGQLNVEVPQEGLIGMYNVMGALGYEMVMKGDDLRGVTTDTIIFKRPAN